MVFTIQSSMRQTLIIPITVIKFPAQSYVCVQSTSEIDEDIVITDIQNCRYYIAT